MLLDDALQLALEHHKAGRLDDAAQIYQKVLDKVPTEFNALRLLGIISRHQEKFDKAIRLLKKAVKQKPDHLEAYIDLADAYKESAGVYTDSLEQSEKYYKKALELKPDFKLALNRLGSFYRENNRLEDAASYFQTMADIDPEYSGGYSKLGATYKNLGDFAKAKEAYLKAIEVSPKAVLALYGLASMEKQTEENNYIKEMKEILDAGDLQAEQESQLYFALAKTYADLKDFDQSFAYLKAGNDHKRSSLNLDQARDKFFHNLIKETFNAKAMRKWGKKIDKAGLRDKESRAAFIVGMPRSGTSLTEQILASHSEVYGAGEAADLFYALFHPNGGVTADNFLHKTKKFAADDFHKLGEQYEELINRHSEDARYIVNKMPGYYLYLGYIHLMMPNAKIIHIKRNPIDNCLSCYQQSFHTGHTYSYDLKDLGTHYRLYQDIMEHWRTVLPEGSFVEINYEDLVANQIEESQRLIEYLGLEWEENCAQYYKTKRAINTASFAQANKPIYNSSVEKWRQYENHLQPLIKALGL